jgi:iron(III) transport system ATP-binding protein
MNHSRILISIYASDLADEMRDILKANNVTALLVTHDQFEAFAIADHIGIMNNGKIVQWDTPYDLYHKPINRYVAEFIGRGCIYSRSKLRLTVLR